MDNETITQVIHPSNSAPTYSGYTVPLSSNGVENAQQARPRKTRLLSQHLFQLLTRAELTINGKWKISRLARKLRACDAAYAIGGNRCFQSICPRCQGIKAKFHRKQVEKIMRSRGDSRFVLLTVTVATDSLTTGYQALQISTRKLRSRKYWRERVVGGVFQSDFKPSDDGYTLRWNVHSHALVELRQGMTMDNLSLAMMWDSYLAEFDLVGDIDVRMINPADLQTSFMPPSFYVTKRVRSELLKMDDSRLIELIEFLPRRRIFSVIGDWRSSKRKSQPSTNRVSVTKEVGHVAG